MARFFLSSEFESSFAIVFWFELCIRNIFVLLNVKCHFSPCSFIRFSFCHCFQQYCHGLPKYGFYSPFLVLGVYWIHGGHFGSNLKIFCQCFKKYVYFFYPTLLSLDFPSNDFCVCLGFLAVISVHLFSLHSVLGAGLSLSFLGFFTSVSAALASPEPKL